jgi:hypothetical protein
MNASGESAREDEGDAGRLREEEGRERLDGLTKLAGGEGDMTLGHVFSQRIWLGRM